MSIRTRIALLVAGIGVGLSLLLTSFSAHQAERLGERIMLSDAAFVAGLLAEDLATGMQVYALDEGASLQRSLGILGNAGGANASVTQVRIFDADLRFLAGLHETSHEVRRDSVATFSVRSQPDHLLAWAPVRTPEGTTLGYVEIVFSKRFVTDSIQANTHQAWLVGIVAVVMTLVAGFVLATRMTRPLVAITERARRIAGGDLAKHEIDVHSDDEVGQLAAAFGEMSSYLGGIADAAHRLSQGDLSVSVTPRSEADLLAQNFCQMADNLRDLFGRLATHADALNDSSTGLSGVSEQAANSVAGVSEGANTVAAAAAQMSAAMAGITAMAESSNAAVNTVASSTEEMTATVTEIAQSAERGRQVAASAVQTVTAASTRVDELGVAAREIDKVIATITEIAEQTKLLALNATIEAASAGDAGKGFAVVATEVKELAKQTDAATDEIRTKIESIQRSAGTTVDEIGQIESVITEVSEIVTSIAAAVEEQAVTTQDIAQNISQVANGIEEMTGNIGSAATSSSAIAADIAAIDSTSSGMTTAVDDIRRQALDLARLGSELRELVGQYRL